MIKTFWVWIYKLLTSEKFKQNMEYLNKLNNLKEMKLSCQFFNYTFAHLDIQFIMYCLRCSILLIKHVFSLDVLFSICDYNLNWLHTVHSIIIITFTTDFDLRPWMNLYRFIDWLFFHHYYKDREAILFQPYRDLHMDYHDFHVIYNLKITYKVI